MATGEDGWIKEVAQSQINLTVRSLCPCASKEESELVLLVARDGKKGWGKKAEELTKKFSSEGAPRNFTAEDLEVKWAQIAPKVSASSKGTSHSLQHSHRHHLCR